MKKDKSPVFDINSADPPRVAVLADGSTDRIRDDATRFADKTGLPLINNVDNQDYDLLFCVTENRYELRLNRTGGPGPVYVDFVNGPMGYARRMNRSGLLFRAVGIRPTPPHVVDATAGLGQDAFLLAHNGCRVTAIERSVVLAAILENGMDRAAMEEDLRSTINNMTLKQGDAREILKTLSLDQTPDVVYLDPMFPPNKKSALVKKEMRLIRRLVGDDLDSAELLQVALEVAGKRVVVKRMLHDPPLGLEPDLAYRGKTTRYDVYQGNATRRIGLPCNSQGTRNPGE